jgi:hypothetical protein
MINQDMKHLLKHQEPKLTFWRIAGEGILLAVTIVAWWFAIVVLFSL